MDEQEARRVYAQLYSSNQAIDEFDQLAFKDEKVTSVVRPWTHLYQLPFVQLLAIYLDMAGLSDIVKSAANADNPQEAWLDFSEKELESIEPPESFDENIPEFFCLLQAVRGSLASKKIFHVTMDILIERALGGDDESLFCAIQVDRTVLSSGVAALRIAQAEVTQDGEFMDHLTKAIKGSRPRRPAEDFDDLRYMMEVMFESAGDEGINSKQIHDTLVVDLELHPSGNEEELDSLRKLIQKRNKLVRK